MAKLLPHRLPAALLAGVVLFVSACGDGGSAADEDPAPSSSESSSITAATTDASGARIFPFDHLEGQVRSRFVADGYEGTAWPVPAEPTSGTHVNDVSVILTGNDGVAAGVDWVPAGTSLQIRAVDNTDLVEFDWPAGGTATGDRADFWVIPEFVDFRDIVISVDGVPTPIGQTGLLYHRVGSGSFDDRDTPEFEGIANKIRQYLRCEEDRWKIANQYFASDLVADGIYENDGDEIALGVQALNWGIEQELAADGVFSLYRECDGTTATDYSETHHSSQWFAGLGRGIFLVASSARAGEYRAEIDLYIDHLETLAGYLTTESVRAHWIERWLYEANGDVFTHKFYMRAAGLGLASALTDDPETAARWSAEARAYAEAGMAQQRSEGINPERGGPDVRYQMYGMWLGIVYRSSLVAGPHRDSLATTIARAIEWEQTRIDDNGVVDFSDSTRSCTKRSTVKEYHPYHMLSVYLLWAHSEPGNEHLFEKALIADAGHRTGANQCPEPAS